MTLRRLLGLVLACSLALGLLAGCEVAASELEPQTSTGGGPGEARPDPDTPEPLIIEQRVAPKGEEFEVRLEGNVTTGYAWRVAEIDEQKVRKVSEDYVEAKQGGQPVVGSGGTFVFRFQPIAEGQTKVVLVYQRSWEKDVEPLRTYRLELVVR